MRQLPTAQMLPFVRPFIPERFQANIWSLRRTTLMVLFAFGLPLAGPLMTWWLYRNTGGSLWAWAPLATATVAFFTPFLLRLTGSALLAGNIFAASAYVNLLAGIWYCQGLQSPLVIFLPLLPVTALHILGQASGKFWGFAVLIGTFALFALPRLGVPYPTLLSPEDLELFRFILYLLAPVLYLVTMCFIEKTRNELTRLVVSQQEQLAGSSRLAALGEMAGGMAHEINNPLAIASLHLQRLARLEDAEEGSDAQSSGSRRASLAQLGDSLSRITRIVRSLQNFARDGSSAPLRAESVSSLIDDTLSLCQESLTRSGIRLLRSSESATSAPASSMPAPALRVNCRRPELDQALFNLLANGRDAALAAAPGERELEVKAGRSGDRAVIAIEDSGPGVPPEFRSLIFEPFFTTKEIGRATGLGLSAARGIVEAHGGKLWLDEASSRTRFVVELPLA